MKLSQKSSFFPPSMVGEIHSNEPTEARSLLKTTFLSKSDRGFADTS